MTHIEKTATLIRVSDTDLTVANPTEDIRGRKVVDRPAKKRRRLAYSDRLARSPTAIFLRHGIQ